MDPIPPLPGRHTWLLPEVQKKLLADTATTEFPGISYPK